MFTLSHGVSPKLKVLRPEVLLCPNIPKPLHGIAPRTILGQQWWNEQRKAAYALTGDRCIACGIHKKYAKYCHWIEAHEVYDINYKKGLMTFKEVVALCHSCHNFIHDGRMQMMVEQKTMTKKKMNEILRHGNLILKNAGLKKPDPPTEVASWDKWRLVIDGKQYKGKFKSIFDWAEYYS